VQPDQRPILALFLRICAALALATLLMLVKVAGESGVSLPEIMFWRQAPTVPLILGWLWWTNGLHRLKTRRLRAHGGRAVVGTTNMIFNFTAAILLPLAESTTLGFTTPLFAVLLAGTVMRQHVGPWRWTAVALGFLGVVVIAQPGNEPISTIGAAAGLLAGFLIAVINFQIRDLGRTEEAICTVFWFGVFGTVLTGAALPFFATTHSPQQWVLLLSLGAVGMFAQILLTASLRYGAVANIIAMDYTALIWATAYGWLIWDRLPPATTWLGAPLIIAAGLIIAWREHYLSRRAANATGT